MGRLEARDGVPMRGRCGGPVRCRTTPPVSWVRGGSVPRARSRTTPPLPWGPRRLARPLRPGHHGRVEAILMTVGLLAVMLGALVVLARFWPRSSRRTGYHIRGGASEDAPRVPEDDDARWRWRDNP